MKFSGLRAFLPLVAVAALGAGGCDKAKSALEDASGFSQLDQEAIDTMLGEAGWDEAANPNLANFKVHFGFELTDKFPGDLGKDVNIPVGVDLPAQAEGAAENQRSIALLRLETIPFGDKTYKRFRIVTVGRFDAAAKEVVIDDALVSQAMDDDQKIGKDTATGQVGKYLLIEGKGSTGLSYLEGTVNLQKADGSAKAPVKGTAVFTSSSPFVTVTGATGKYFLAMLDGSKGQIMSYKGDIASAYAAPGTPPSSTVDIPYAGALDKYEDKADEKTAALGSENSDAVMAKFAEANTKITDACTKYGIPGCSWTLLEAHLTHVQPPQKKADEPTIPQGKPDPKPTEPAKDDPKPEDPLPTDTVIQRDPGSTEDTVPQVDLSCTGFMGDDFESSQVFDGSLFDGDTKGWRFQGDVRITGEAHEAIFGDPADLGANYPDVYPGYCLLTTGDQYFNMTGEDALFQPGPNGAGRTSEMWQKVAIPAAAKSIQVRVAFFSQEFPQYVGSQFNDSFFIKFDESPSFIATGNLNDLAGAADATLAESVTACKTLDGKDQDAKCGEWQFVGNDPDKLYGDMWMISESKQGPKNGEKYGCIEGAGPCYHGYIPSRIICQDLAAGEAGTTMTLRFGVADAGDSFYDSALAVDTVAFSTEACAAEGDGARMTPEEIDPDSRINTL